MSFPGRGEAVVEGGGIEMIRGLLDQDVYKFSTQQAVLQLYPRALAEYKLINRGSHFFSGRVMEDLQMWVNGMEGMILPAAEAKWMLNNLPFLTPAYIDFLRGYRFNASEVKINGGLPIHMHCCHLLQKSALSENHMRNVMNDRLKFPDLLGVHLDQFFH